MILTTSQHGFDLIRKWEGFRADAYKDVAGIPTIGYGHTKGVQMGQTIAKDQAERFLREDLLEAEKAVNRLVTVPIEQYEFDALTSFTYNLGAGSLAGSTLLRLFNAGDRMNAALNFVPWCKAKVNGELVPVTGLILRRCDETRVFLGA